MNLLLKMSQYIISDLNFCHNERSPNRFQKSQRNLQKSPTQPSKVQAVGPWHQIADREQRWVQNHERKIIAMSNHHITIPAQVFKLQCQSQTNRSKADDHQPQLGEKVEKKKASLKLRWRRWRKQYQKEEEENRKETRKGKRTPSQSRRIDRNWKCQG